jgi:alkanesulfonate monooxygenase SsuD/methylene tetrahydromethanopterin reductase-like flavin-dependent oxidoreductase (luciferase family)
VDDVRALLDHRVAEAAEAWLADPRDAGVYARLVVAVAERRAALDAPRGAGRAGAPQEALPDDPQPEGSETSAGDGLPPSPLLPVGADLVGDPRAVLDRLRRP